LQDSPERKLKIWTKNSYTFRCLRNVREVADFSGQTFEILKNGADIVRQHQSYVSNQYWYMYDLLALALEHHGPTKANQDVNFLGRVIEYLIHSKRDTKHTVALNKITAFFLISQKP